MIKFLFALIVVLVCSVGRCRTLSLRPSSSSDDPFSTSSPSPPRGGHGGSTNAFQIVSTNKNGGRSHTFIVDPKHQQVVENDNKTASSSSSPSSSFLGQRHYSSSLRNLLKNIQSGLRSTFLPSGFPSKTPQGYLRYALWSCIQDLSTQLRGVLATQRILEGVGVGKEGATAMSAVLNFLVRDGCGMLASLGFTSMAAPLFRTDVKRWRLFADIMVDVGITLEVAAVQVPAALFLPFISVGSMCKAMCGVAAGACSGPINLYWATGSDISDISAKFGAQNTVTGFMGIAFAWLFAKSVATLPLRPLWFLYGVLTCLHVLANRRCMRLIAFNSFNTLRMDMILSRFFQDYDSSKDEYATTILSPQQVSRFEPLLFTSILPGVRPTHPIHLGVSFHEFLDHTREHTQETPNLLLGIEKDYWIAFGTRAKNPQILVALPENVCPTYTAKAYFHARLLDHLLVTNNDASDDSVPSIEETEAMASKLVDKAWKVFAKASSQSGWNLSETELKTKGFEVALTPL